MKSNQSEVLSLRNISKSFQQRGLVLNNLDLEVIDGECISIMGPSGTGKTTLLNIIGLLDKPDSGEVFFRGSQVLGYTSDESASYRNKNIGFVFQEHHLLPYLTVYENIILPSLAFPHSLEETETIKRHVSILMERIGITSLSGKHPFQISGGEAQRAAIVRALVNSPTILLADEPTGSLDAKNGDILGDLLLEMNRDIGVALIIATHSQILAGKMSRRMKLNDGRLLTSD
jgi:lipoprotein-releasing system ATP-binding protein